MKPEAEVKVKVKKLGQLLVVVSFRFRDFHFCYTLKPSYNE